MIKRLALTILLTTVLRAAAAHAGNGAFSVMTPPDRAVVESRSIAVVLAAGAAPFDTLQLTVDDRQQRQLTNLSQRKVVCIDGIPLSVGINRITLTAFRGRTKVGEERLAVMVRSDLSSLWSQAPVGYRSYPFHGGSQERGCLPCHELQFSAAASNPASPAQSPCYVCHKRMMGSVRNLHGPAAVWSCLMCHNPKGETPSPLAADNSQCAECHGDSMDDWQGKKHVHGPLAVGSCTACHSPHGSDQEAFLKLPVFDLCTSCHEGVKARHHTVTGLARKEGPVYLACSSQKPGKPLFCTACHNPHAAEAPYVLRNARETQVQSEYCQSCHTHI
jgi:predicted CXXCH cytochrome family protein